MQDKLDLADQVAEVFIVDTSDVANPFMGI